MSGYNDSRAGGGGSPPDWQRSRHDGGHPQQQHQHQQQQQQHRDGLGSWVEIDSQPPSSSVSSLNDEIVTTGLRVGGSSASSTQPTSTPRRRRMSQQPLHPIHQQQNARARAARAHVASTGTSSQEDNGETSSEDDHIASSTEHVHVGMPRPTPATSATPAAAPSLPIVVSDVEAYADDSGEHATTLGRAGAAPIAASRATFQPQPNAFSHPPTNITHRHSLPAPPNQGFRSRRPSDSRFHRRSVPGDMEHGPTFGRDSHVSPYREDNDAVLRASLTTLLSYATAARGLQKSVHERASGTPGGTGSPSGAPRRLGNRGPVGAVGAGAGVTVGAGAGVGAVAGGPRVGPSSQPVELALVPESDIPDMGEPMPMPATATAAVPTVPTPSPSRPRPRPRSPKRSSTGRPKGSSSTSGGTRDPRTAKKKRTAFLGSDDALISPTVLSWVVGASVVVFFSVVGFGAGYVIGREVGRQEALSASVGVNASTSGAAARAAAESASSCGRQAAVTLGSSSGLKKLKWGGTLMASSIIA